MILPQCPTPPGTQTLVPVLIKATRNPADAAKVFSRPDVNCACASVLKLMRTGSFRSQSTIIDCILSSLDVDMPCHVKPINQPPPHTVRARGSKTWSLLNQVRGPTISGTLLLLAGDDGMPLLHAALDLCAERERADSSSAGKPEVLVKEQKSFAQNCCEDPYDCEEPAVREAALKLLARICAILLLPLGQPELVLEQAAAARLAAACCSVRVVKAVLQAMQVGNATVVSSASQALSGLLKILSGSNPPESARLSGPEGSPWERGEAAELVRRFIRRHLPLALDDFVVSPQGIEGPQGERHHDTEALCSAGSVEDGDDCVEEEEAEDSYENGGGK